MLLTYAGVALAQTPTTLPGTLLDANTLGAAEGEHYLYGRHQEQAKHSRQSIADSLPGSQITVSLDGRLETFTFRVRFAIEDEQGTVHVPWGCNVLVDTFSL